MDKYIKYPRTYHLPWSNTTSDDKMLDTDACFENKHVIVTEKLDGENTTLYNDYVHARSLTYSPHSSRNFVKKFHANIAWQIPDDIRICCENVTALHSIPYDNLPFFLFGISVWEKEKCLAWNESEVWFEKLSIPSVPLLYSGVYNSKLIHKVYETIASKRLIEGYVVRITNAFNYSDFNNSVAKYVRPNHVQTDEHWSHKSVVFNGFKK